MTLDVKIAQAEHHVDSGRRIIERQRVLVVRLGQPFAADLLDERTQRIFEMDLAD